MNDEVLDGFPTRVLRDQPANAQEDLIGRLAEEMHRRWQSGDCPRAEEYLQRHPELGDGSEAVLRIIYEEFCLRQEAGEQVAPAEFYERFPHWRQRLKALLDCHHLLVPEPTPLDELAALAQCQGEFTIVGELGKGSQGSVFLALQANLANRPVVLKVSPTEGEEHLSLARLQHTHIVPLYAYHADPETKHQVLCMPYLGGATLEQILDHLRPIPLAKRKGQDILDALDRAQAGSKIKVSTQGPGRAYLARVNHAQALCWFGACLADALHFAHQRDLIHLDMKPSNILVTTDGQPMLLDFHIAQQPLRPQGPVPPWIGGTPRYSSPEQLAAMKAMAGGDLIPLPVDARSDLYSLGVVLYKALGGTIPFPEDKDPPRLDAINSQVSPGLGDILARCLKEKAAERYPTCQALAEDLRRHLSNQPLQGVRNRSLRERWSKWRRRRPYALHLLVMLLAVLGATAAFGLLALDNLGRENRLAQRALHSGKEHLAQRRFAAAQEAFLEGLARCENLPASSDLKQSLARQLTLARRLREVEDLHGLVERLRSLAGPGNAKVPATLEESWGRLWAKRAEWLEFAAAEMSENERHQLRTDLFDLGLLWVDLRLRTLRKQEAPPSNAMEETWRLLEEMDRLFQPTPMTARLREACALVMDRQDEAKEARGRAEKLAPRTAWEHFALGRLLLSQGKLAEARTALDRSLALQPGEFWPNFFQGICALKQKQPQEAAAAFRVCLAFQPRHAPSFLYRGQAHALLGHFEDAFHDFTRALDLDPTLAEAALQRGILQRQAKNYPPALIDLRSALDKGANPAEAHFQLALLYQEQGDLVTARNHLRLALDNDPRHVEARELNRMGIKEKPRP